MAPPAVMVVGDVVDLREALSWFETKPLFGWRVLVPRTKEQAGSLSPRLRGFGAVPEEVPTISVEPPRNPLQMDKAVRGLVEGRYEWIAFTSVNAVQRGAREVRRVRPRRPRVLRPQDRRRRRQDRRRRSRPGACGPTWCRPASSRRPACSRTGRRTTTLLDPINRVFLPRADIATETLVAGLIELGWEFDDVTAYRTVRAAPPPAPTRDAIKTGKFDAVVFTSSSTVRNLVGIAGKPHPSTVIAVIGPATAKTAEEHGLRVDVLAPQPDVEVLVDALADFGAARRLAMLEAGRAGHQAVGAQARRRVAGARRSSMVDGTQPRSPGRSSGRAGCAVPRRCGGWSPRPRWRRGQLVLPLFVREGLDRAASRSRSMPGVVQHTRDSLRKAAAEAAELGLGGVMLFGIPEPRTPPAPAPSTPTASSTSRSPTWSPRWATRSP